MGENKKLIIVDDSVTSRQIIRAMVARQRRDWVIFESDNGYDAIDMAEMLQPDFITMDVNMPKLSGLEASEMILAKWPNTRIVLVTANIQEAVQERARVMGVGFLEKPISEKSITGALAFFEAGGDHGQPTE